MKEVKKEFRWFNIMEYEKEEKYLSKRHHGRKCDRIKAILKEPDGIVMIYKRLTAQGSYRWPRDKSEVRNLTWREFDWLMSGIDIEQPKAIKTT